jgi:hypothetical protein
LDRAWAVTVVGDALSDCRAQRNWSARDDAGNTYETFGGTGAERFECNFAPGLADNATVVTVDLQIGVSSARFDIALDAPRRAASATLLRVEGWPSDRWKQEWRPLVRPDTYSLFADFEGRLLPDEIIPLNASVGEVATREFVFLSAERWGGTWLLRHHAVRDDPMYSPLFRPWVECEWDDRTVAALAPGGGTAGWGFTYAHMFRASEFPERLIVRCPATDGGPPLFEVELRTH